MRALPVLLGCLLWASTATAQRRSAEPPVVEDADLEPSSADDWLQLGLQRYQAGDFKGAIDAFQRGHALDPRPQFLFAIAQAERLRGNCKGAVVYYDRFLATSPPEEQAEAAAEQVRRCEEVIAAGQDEAPPEPPRTTAAPVITSPPPPAPRPWYRDGVTVATGGAATALVLSGGAFLLASDAAARDAGNAFTYEEYGELKDRAELRQQVGVVVLSASALVAAYTAYRIIRGGDRPAEPRRHVGVVAGPGLGLALGGRF